MAQVDESNLKRKLSGSSHGSLSSSSLRPRSASVMSTSSLSSLSSSDLSELSDSEEAEESSEDERRPPRKRVRLTRPRRFRSPSPSGSSGDEDENGVAKPGKKLYCAAGLYWVAPARPLNTDGTLQIEAQTPAPEDAMVLESAPLAVPENAQPETQRLSKRASAAVASAKFARNGRGSLPGQPKADKESKPVVEPTLLPRPNTSLFPDVIHEFAQEVMDEERSFRLPAQMIRDFNPLGPGRLNMIRRANAWREPPRYQELQQNTYPQRNRDRVEFPAICHCSKKTGCDENCINRLMFYLCSEKLCASRWKCSNLPFNERDPLCLPNGEEATEVFYTGSRGFGLRTLVDIPADTFIMEYRGEVISRDESYKRVTGVYRNRHDYYFLDYDGEEVIDAGLKGNATRFCNHSCAPNCKMVRYRLADYEEYQIGLFAATDIKKGAELTYDYGWVTFASLKEESGEALAPEEQAKVSQPCHCGAEECRGTLGGKKKGQDARNKFKKRR